MLGAGFSTWEAAVQAFADTNETLLNYCDNLQKSVQALEQRVKALEDGKVQP